MTNKEEAFKSVYGHYSIFQEFDYEQLKDAFMEGFSLGELEKNDKADKYDRLMEGIESAYAHRNN